ELLARIGLGSSNAQAWVDSSGRFRLGPLEGRFAKPAAEHIGEGAREAQRRRRIGELSVDIAALEELRSAHMTAIEALRMREEAVASEEAAVPDDQPVRLAAARLTTALQETADSRGRLVEAETRLAEAKRQLRGRVDARNSAAADLGLGAWTEDLPGLTEAIGAYRAGVSALETKVRAMGDLERASADLGSSEGERDGAIQSLGRLATNGLLAVAVPGSPTEPIDASPTRAIEAARATEEALSRVDAGDVAWD